MTQARISAVTATQSSGGPLSQKLWRKKLHINTIQGEMMLRTYSVPQLICCFQYGQKHMMSAIVRDLPKFTSALPAVKKCIQINVSHYFGNRSAELYLYHVNHYHVH